MKKNRGREQNIKGIGRGEGNVGWGMPAKLIKVSPHDTKGNCNVLHEQYKEFIKSSSPNWEVPCAKNMHPNDHVTNNKKMINRKWEGKTEAVL
eukprot:TRINITY_DN3077_c0_g1_i4.p1 TRINITY_DN3077_c0_g1~~TRINITY_DN3077_c0_g1_i4.p1  ORF type:complete len:106 (-),score=15.93 TRINITY_DN3077_c0_g1_i4:195-473(-)